MEKRIKNHEQYSITDTGEVFSYKYRTPKKMSLWISKNGYQYANLCENNIMKHYAVHRLVAEAFIPNPNNLPEVNHKNCNKLDNRVENLEWCDRKYNIHYQYSSLGPARNKISCFLVDEKTNLRIKSFENIKAASEYANKNYGCSKSSMIKYGHSKGFKIERCND